jgi:hypothetical protein
MPRGPRGEKRPYKRVKLFASGKLGWLVLGCPPSRRPADDGAVVVNGVSRIRQLKFLGAAITLAECLGVSNTKPNPARMFWRSEARSAL